MADEKDIWFPAKTQGLGWSKPKGWQGWCVQLLYLASVGVISMLVDPKVALLEWLFGVSICTGVLFVIYYIKGEAPSWPGKNHDDQQ